MLTSGGEFWSGPRTLNFFFVVLFALTLAPPRFLWGASPHDVASVGGAAPPVVSGGEFQQHLPPTLPPLGEFQTPARRTSSPRSHRSSVDVARCECSAVDVAWPCCSPVDVAWPCCSVVDVAWPCCSAVDIAWPCCSAVDVAWPCCSANSELLLLTPPPVPCPASHSPHRPLYVPSSSSGPIAGPDFLGWAKKEREARHSSEIIKMRCTSTAKLVPPSLRHHLPSQEGPAAPLLPEAAKPSPPILTTFYRETVGSVLSSCLTVWYGNCKVSEHKTLQQIVRTAEKIIDVSLLTTNGSNNNRCIRKAISIAEVSPHEPHGVFTLLPSGMGYRSIRVTTSRLHNSFFPEAGRLLNTPLPPSAYLG
ncbi:hypothetical protein QTP86_007734 [Hemibagrus guttatus]|nr:hypothetical protein QTP86_007734 [Hemibagrus guttatus]